MYKWFLPFVALGLNMEFVLPTYKLLSDSGNFYTAERLCHKEGWSLPYDNGTSLEDYLEYRNVSSTWMNIRLRYLNSWTWVNGSSASNMCDSCNHCGKISLTSSLSSHLSEGTYCEELNIGFICNLKDDCPSNTELLCQRVGEHYLLIGCETKNWFTARTTCKKHSGDLLTISYTMKQILISAILPTVKCPGNKYQPDFFIGLRRLEFYTPTISGESKDIDHSKWQEEQPSQFHDCVSIEKSQRGDRYGWRTKDCLGKEAIVCQADVLENEKTEATVLQTSSTEVPGVNVMSDFGKHEDKEMWPYVVFPVSLFFNFIQGVTLLVIIIICRKRRRSGSENISFIEK